LVYRRTGAWRTQPGRSECVSWTRLMLRGVGVFLWARYPCTVGRQRGGGVSYERGTAVQADDSVAGVFLMSEVPLYRRTAAWRTQPGRSECASWTQILIVIGDEH